MHIPIPRASSSPSPLDMLDLTTATGGPTFTTPTTNTDTIISEPTVPGPTRRHRDSISFFLPIFIISIVLIIVILSLVFARCIYHRFKAMRLSPSPSNSSWKAYSSTTYGSNDHTHHPHHYHDENSDSDLEEDERTEQERLLARRRSTSYYDANRSRAPVAVVIQHDAKGRPISTWSTASSVAAQRGEELSRWSRRRDDLIKIYGQQGSQLTNSNSFAEGAAEEEEDEEDRSRSGYGGHSHQGLLAVEGQEQHHHRGGGPMDGVSELGESHAHSHNQSHTHAHFQNPLEQQETGTTHNSQRSSRVTTTSTLQEQQQHGGP